MKRKTSLLLTFAMLSQLIVAFPGGGNTVSAAKMIPYAPDGYTAHYSFDNVDEENERFSVVKPGSWQGVNPSSGIDENADAVYSSAQAMYGQSLDLTAGNYGIELAETIPQNSSYTVSFWGYVTENVSENNCAVFIDSNDYADDNSVITESWHRICPYGGNRTYNQEYVFQYRNNDTTSIVWSGIDDSDISGAWHLFTVTYDINAKSASTKLYLDGAEVTNSEKDAYVQPLTGESNVYIGVNPWAYWDGTFKGYIDDLYIYNSVLPADEIAKIYKGNVAETEPIERIYSDTANISALYTFNDLSENGTRTKAEDRSGNGNDAILTGASSYVLDPEKGSKVLYTNGAAGSYMEFPLPKDENGNVSEYFTVSMDMKNLTEGNYFNFYVGNGVSSTKGTNYFGYKMSNNILLSASDYSTEKKTTLTGKGVQGDWVHVDFVISGGVCTMYIDGKNVGTMEGYPMSDIRASVGRLSFSAWSPDNYAKCYYENVVVYDKALSPAGIASLEEIDDPEDNIDEAEISLNITDEKGVDIQDEMIGLFFEDINYAADGGLYAEMIENRSFESVRVDNPTPVYDGGWAWSAYPSNGSGAKMEYKTDSPLNDNNTHYLEFTPSSSQSGFANAAYEGLSLKSGQKYNGSLYARTDSFTGTVKISAVKNGTVYAEAEISGITDEWKKYEFDMTSSAEIRGAQLVVTLNGTGTVDFDMISLFPDDAVMGLFRKDLAEMLKDLNPGFLRFSGGCIIEGYNLDNRYQWKNSVGPVEERIENWNRWDLHQTNDAYNHYNQTLGLGFYEYFLLCEYLDCRPVPVLNVGMACEYQSSETVPVFESDGVTYTKEFYQYIQDALDLIEFANGDPATSEWAALRAEMGHPEPFNLDMIGIGNEQWEKTGNQWYARYEAFEKEIHDVYPEMKLVGTSGPGVQDNDYNKAWSWIREKSAENPNFVSVVDEHYYREPSWFYDNINFYDSYPRDVKVFAGEYASRRQNKENDPGANTWEAALSEASYLTMVERNADVVYMASYAPLFARLNYTQWSPDMIWFDDAKCYGSPTYYVQKMYSNNMGDYTLKSELKQLSPEQSVYQNASYDEETGDIIVKIANPGTTPVEIPVTFDGDITLTGKATVERMSNNDIFAVNSIDNPKNVAPETVELEGIESGCEFELPAYSFSVIRIQTKEKSSDPAVTDAVYANGEVTFTLENAQGIPCKAYAAEYKDNSFIGLKLADVNAASDSEKISIPMELKDENNSIKLYLWNTKLTPVTKSVEIK